MLTNSKCRTCIGLGLAVLLGYAAARLQAVLPSPAALKGKEAPVSRSERPAQQPAQQDDNHPAQKPTGESKPNIVFILTDNLGYGELGCYGGGILRGAPTPRIDKLATEGLRLLNFNVESQCTPSRSALMTGRFSLRPGTMTVPRGRPYGLTQWEITIAKLLSQQVYATGHFGKWHLGDQEGRLPTNQGFDVWYGIPNSSDVSLWTSAPQFGAKVTPIPHILEGRKGEMTKELEVYDLKTRRLIDTEITRRTIDFMKRNAKASKP